MRAITKGEWVLLDEINLATPETLESLCSLLESREGSITLADRGDNRPLVRSLDLSLVKLLFFLQKIYIFIFSQNMLCFLHKKIRSVWLNHLSFVYCWRAGKEALRWPIGATTALWWVPSKITT